MKTKDYKGITLIALIVTIVVLIILAGVTISMVVGDNGILTQAINAADSTDMAQTKEEIELALVGYYDEQGKYTEDDVLSAVQDVLGSSATIDETDGVYTVTTTKGNTVDLTDLISNATNISDSLNDEAEIILGISDDEEGDVIGEISSGKDTGIMYVKVTGEDVGSNYDTDSYPTTTCTFTEDGETHNYIFAGWYEVDDGESYFTAIPSSENESAYAKFVDADVLGVKCVFTPSSITGSYNAWRFVSSIDSVFFSECYHNVQDTEYVAPNLISSSYRVGSYTFYTYDFSSFSKYIYTNYFMDNSAATSCTVKAGYKTLDGTKVYGSNYTFDASDCTSQTVLSGTVSYENYESLSSDI